MKNFQEHPNNLLFIFNDFNPRSIDEISAVVKDVNSISPFMLMHGWECPRLNDTMRLIKLPNQN